MLFLVVLVAICDEIDKIDPRVREIFDEFVEISPPTPHHRRKILDFHAKSMKLTPSIVETEWSDILNRISDSCHGYVGIDIVNLCESAQLYAQLRHFTPSTFQPRTVNVEPMDDSIYPVDFKSALSTIRPHFVQDVVASIPSRKFSRIVSLIILAFSFALELMNSSWFISNMVLNVDVKWEDIGGLDEVKHQLQEVVIWPYLHEKVKRYSIFYFFGSSHRHSNRLI